MVISRIIALVYDPINVKPLSSGTLGKRGEKRGETGARAREPVFPLLTPPFFAHALLSDRLEQVPGGGRWGDSL